MTTQSSRICIYAELHWTVRRPNITVKLNSINQTLAVDRIDKVSDDQENTVFSFSAPLADNNVLEIVMQDKTDSDILEIDGKWTDHYVDIKEIEVDGIKFEMALYRNSEFRHTMPQSWVDDMAQKKIIIENSYPNCTEMRLNGVVTVKFNSPVWRWVTEDLAKIWNEDAPIH